ncbi:MAG TPA: hypothetical protein DEB42_03085 [Jeotgalicoccus sp.]|nr:hypothetical protein [Jeotgalicoccus sp.]
MKKWMILLLMTMLFILAACGNSEEAEPENDTSEETDSDPAEKTTDQPEEESGDESESAEDTSEEKPAEAEKTEQSSTEEDISDNEETDEVQNTDETNGNSSNEINYTAAENCIMTQLTECQNVPEADQFQAYSDLVADGTLPQAPGSGCLPCAVKYSFEVKYGESNPVNPAILPRSDKIPGEITNPSEFVQQYLFSLPAFFNNQNEVALSFYLTDSPGYNVLFANKASGNYSNHMTYSVFIDSEVENLDGSMYVYTTREYSHINTDSVYEVYARYQVVEQDGRLYLTDYAELENTRVE